jgi:hypothetical protein
MFITFVMVGLVVILVFLSISGWFSNMGGRLPK